MRNDLLLAEPVPHPLLCSLPTPLLRALLGETTSSFRALLWGRRGTPPAPGALLLRHVARLSLEGEHRRLVALAQSTPRRAEAIRTARIARVLRRLVDRGHDASRLFVTSIPLHDERDLEGLPEGPELLRLERAVEAESRAFGEGSAEARIRLRRAVFALVRASRRWLARHDPLRPDRRRPRRVDFSGRAAVVPDPALRLDQCGLPIAMAFELFRLHLAGELVRRRLAPSPGEARRLVDARTPILTPILEEISAHHPVILSAGEALSRHRVQAYFPVLSPAKAVGLSPMALRRLAGDEEIPWVKVFLPLGERAQDEARQRMTSPATMVDPASDRPRIELSADARIGLYLASLARTGRKGRAPRPEPRREWDAIRVGESILHGRGLAPAEEEKLRRLRRLQRAHVHRFGALRGFFASLAEVERAVDAGELSINAPIFVRIGSRTLSTVAGRCLLMALLPAEVPCELANADLDTKALDRILAASVEALGRARTAKLAEAIEALGLRLVTAHGASLSIGDLVVPPSKQAVLDEGRRGTRKVVEDYEEGMITGGERYHRIIDVWAGVTDELASLAAKAIHREEVLDPDTGRPGFDPSNNPLHLSASSGVRRGRVELRAMVAMRGLVSMPSGEIVEAPIVESLREGLPPHACFLTAAIARADRIRAQHRAREDRSAAAILLEALGDTRIVATDCGALGALPLGALADGSEEFRALADRVRGRALAGTGEILDREAALRLAGDGSGEIAVRSPVFCEAINGICATCHGIDPSTGALPESGEPVGLHAAHALASRLDQVGTRTFHIGGGGAHSTGYPPSRMEAPEDGTVVLRSDEDDAIAVKPDGTRVVMAGAIAIAIRDEQGFDTACGFARRGAALEVAPGERVKRGKLLASWDLFARASLAERDGTVRWADLAPGTTLHARLDEVTGLTRWMVDVPAGVALRPHVSIVGDDGAVLQVLPLDAGQAILVEDGYRVHRGEEIARQLVEIAPVLESLAGRPDLLRLLLGRTEDPAVLCEIDGVAEITAEADRSCKVTVRPMDGAAGESRTYRVPPDRYCHLQDGDHVRPGEGIVGGTRDPEDVLTILGPERGARHIVDSLEIIYASFGVRLDTRHAEIAARAMLRWVRITRSGDGPWAPGELVERSRFERCCEALAQRGLGPPSGAPAVAGLGVRGAA